MVLGGAGVLAVFGGSVVPDLVMRMNVARGRGQVFDGVVTDFTPGDPGDHVTERWVLQTPNGRRTYAYSPSIIGPGYDRTAAHGGLVRDGLNVRVTDVGGWIARLEIGR